MRESLRQCVPGGLEDLEVYRQEVVHGVHDHWIDPKAGKWEYTYHERLFCYRVPGAGVFDQIARCVDKLAEAPHTRRAQAVTWQVWNDLGISDPACLQRLWFRIQDDRLYLNVHMRSNDAYKAAYMNMFAFTDIQRMVAGQLTERLGVIGRPSRRPTSSATIRWMSVKANMFMNEALKASLERMWTFM